jgi:hypothetical protein
VSESVPESAPPPKKVGWFYYCLAAFPLVVGVLARLSQFSSGRALWLDEIQLCGNLLERSYGGLLEPLNYSQVAPTLYLFTLKACTDWFGMNVFSVRLPSVVGGLLLVLVFWWMARRMVGARGALWAVVMVALSQHLISYSGEAKPYSLDAFWTVLLVWLALRAEPGKAAWKSTVPLALAGMVAVWFSYPSVFVIAGVGTAHLASALLQREGKHFGILCVVYGLAALSFLVEYLVIMAPIQAHMGDIGYLDNYWRHGFMPFPPETMFELRWFRERPFLFLDMPGGFTLLGLALFVALAGTLQLLFERPKHFFMVILPFVFTLLACGLRLYPFHGRMTLFLAPLLFLVMGHGFVALSEGGRKPAATALVLAVLLLAQPAVRAVRVAREPSRHHELDRVLHHVSLHWREGDRLYLPFPDSLSYRFLEEALDIPSEAVVLGVSASAEGGETPFEEILPKLRDAERLWFACTYDYVETFAPQRKLLEAHGKTVDEAQAAGASAWAVAFPAAVTP